MGKMNPPAISVVIPCYNGSKYLHETLKSVLAQTFPPLEVIVVDDGSTDDSAAIAESYGPPVRVIRQPNQGESVARNRGIEEANGEWVAFLDADDMWLPEKLAEQAKLMAPEVGAVCSSDLATYPDGRTKLHTPRPAFFKRARILEHGAPCHISSLVVRRNLPVRFPAWTKNAEDIVYYLDLCQWARFAIAPQPLTVYRLHSGGQTANPEMGERRDASLAKWLQLNQDQIPKIELHPLLDASARRQQWSLLHRALRYRQENTPLVALGLYSRVVVRSLFTPSSSQIVRHGLRSILGTVLETVRIRKHPSVQGAQPHG
jgi:glycosyltransferase involved in cell wall biosynthesis